MYDNHLQTNLNGMKQNYIYKSIMFIFVKNICNFFRKLNLLTSLTALTQKQSEFLHDIFNNIFSNEIIIEKLNSWCIANAAFY